MESLTCFPAFHLYPRGNFARFSRYQLKVESRLGTTEYEVRSPRLLKVKPPLVVHSIVFLIYFFNLAGDSLEIKGHLDEVTVR